MDENEEYIEFSGALFAFLTVALGLWAGGLLGMWFL